MTSLEIYFVRSVSCSNNFLFFFFYVETTTSAVFSVQKLELLFATYQDLS